MPMSMGVQLRLRFVTLAQGRPTERGMIYVVVMEGHLAAVTSLATLYDWPKKSQGLIQFKVTSHSQFPDAPMFLFHTCISINQFTQV